MKILYVEIHNILSIEKARLDFGSSGLILLDGWNYDDNTANGAGKSAFLNSITFGLYGKVPRKISISEVLREGTKSGYVKVGIESDDSLYEIVRHRPNSVQYFIDGHEVTTTQEEFESKLKLNYNQYLISMYSAQTEGLKLISMNDSSKKDFFLQLMNLEKFADCKGFTDVRLKEILAETTTLKAKEGELQSRSAAFFESIVDPDELNSLMVQEDPSSLIKKLKQLESISVPDVSKYDDLEEKLDNYLTELSVMDAELKHKKVRLSELKHSVEDSIECPHCSGEFLPSGSSLETHNSAIQDLVQQINSYPVIIEEKLKVKEKIQKCRGKRAEDLKDYNSVVQTISELKSKINIKKSKIEGYKKSIEKNDELLEKIDTCKDKLKDISLKLATLEDERQITEAISGMFGPAGATAYIMDSAVDALNEKIADHIGMIWPNASYSLQSFKENKSGELRAKFSERLIINGKEKSTGSLSGGEHRCLSLALDFAVIAVLESMFGIQLNPIMLDEPFNDLDASNRERVIELLEKLAVSRQIWIIDHASEAKAMFSNVVRVEKHNEISRLV